ncbi:barstar family protein [Candidatus Gracilibacteria bacterium]|nr:barstar family protein [Candidatus Gracilibacteria bacterium]
MIQGISLDVSNISNKEDLFDLFSQTFGFPSYFGKNWDAFEEVLSGMNFEKITGINITGIHLSCVGYDRFKINFPTGEREIFESILTDISANSNQLSQSLLFTFEMK